MRVNRSVAIVIAIVLSATCSLVCWRLHSLSSHDESVNIGRMNDARQAITYYTWDHNSFPDASKWEDEIKPYSPDPINTSLISPPGEKPRRIAMNARLSNRVVDREGGGEYTYLVLFEIESDHRNSSANVPVLKWYEKRVVCDLDACGFVGSKDLHKYEYLRLGKWRPAF